MNFKNQKAIYMQIADHVIDNILAQNINGGDRMQSVREMAENVQVNPNTVMRSYSYLQDEGLIFNKRGIGYFIVEDALNRTQNMKKTNFIQKALPEFFRQMDLLGIDFEELEKLYKASKNGAAKE
ncbi:MAG: GntR family transcriptional regulator [Saprospiraceae bacterium]|jgi:GntR family transcriptional regulator